MLTGTSDVAHLEKNVAAVDSPTLPEPDIDRLTQVLGDLSESAKE